MLLEEPESLVAEFGPWPIRPGGELVGAHVVVTARDSVKFRMGAPPGRLLDEDLRLAEGHSLVPVSVDQLERRERTRRS